MTLSTETNSSSRRLLCNLALNPPKFGWPPSNPRNTIANGSSSEGSPKAFYQTGFWTRIATCPEFSQSAPRAWLSALRLVGAFAVAEAGDLAEIPLNRMPKRVLPIFPNSFPSAEEFDTADAVEIQFSLLRPTEIPVPNGYAQQRLLPYDCPTLALFQKKFEAIRNTLTHDVPVGMAMVKGRLEEELPSLLQVKPDFVSLIDARQPRIEPCIPDGWFAQRARSIATAAGLASLPIFIESDVRSGEEIVKLVALGATAVTLDSIYLDVHRDFRKSLQRDSIPSGLGGLSLPTSTVPPMAKLEQSFVGELQAIQQGIRYSLETLGVSTIQDLRPDCLIALTDEASRLTGLPFLGR